MSLNTNINLDKPNGTGETLILHSITTGNIRFRINSGQKIHPNDFDKINQCVKKKVPGAEKLNALLEKQQNQIKDACRLLSFNGRPITKDAVTALLPFTLRSKPHDISFDTIFSEWLNSSKNRVAKSTLSFYSTLFSHLQTFSKKRNYPLSFDRLNLSFHENFIDYLYNDVKCYDNYCGKVIRNLKTFMYWSKDKKYHSNSEFVKWRAPEEKDKDPICLSQEEVKQLENHVPSTETIQKVKDLFLLQCYTGLRFSDMQNLNPENIRDKMITVTTLKTKQRITIPLIGKAEQIIQKYSNEVGNNLPVISNQKMNEYLKDLFKEADLSRKIQKIKIRGSHRNQETYLLHEVISSHAGRHTFATISLMLGIDAETVKEITGHKKHETFKRYLHLTDKFKAEKMKLWETI